MTHTAPAAPVDQLADALDTTGSLVAELRAEELSLPTPCSGWTVRDLLAHLVGGQLLFAQLLRGGEPAPARIPWAPTPPRPPPGRPARCSTRSARPARWNGRSPCRSGPSRASSRCTCGRLAALLGRSVAPA